MKIIDSKIDEENNEAYVDFERPFVTDSMKTINLIVKRHYSVYLSYSVMSHMYDHLLSNVRGDFFPQEGPHQYNCIPRKM